MEKYIIFEEHFDLSRDPATLTEEELLCIAELRPLTNGIPRWWHIVFPEGKEEECLEYIQKGRTSIVGQQRDAIT